MKITKRSLATGALAALLGLIAVVGLVVPLLRSGGIASENGYALLSMRSPFFFAGMQKDGIKIMQIAFGVLGAFQCAIGAMLIAVGILNIFFESTSGYCRGLSVACFVFIALYCAEGIIALGVYNESGILPVSTLSFLPLIFAVVVFIGYFLCGSLLPESVLWAPLGAADLPPEFSAVKGSEVPLPAASESPDEQAEERTLRYLNEYLRLLKEGAITQSEYEEAKRRILGGKGGDRHEGDR